MRLLADEYIPPAIVSALRGEGHDVALVGEDVDLGSEDGVLLEYARDTNRLILIGISRLVHILRTRRVFHDDVGRQVR